MTNLLPLSILVLCISYAQAQSATDLAARHSLTQTLSLPFPTTTLSSSQAQTFLKSDWGLARGSLQQGGDDLAFVSDPFASGSSSSSTTGGQNGSSSGSVLQVTYPQGSFSHETGGAQFINLFNASSSGSSSSSSKASSESFNSMLLTYDLAFDSDFDFVRGGKLPGLRGGNGTTGCSGGEASDGANCFTARLMWRENGAGEVYAYIPSPTSLCDGKNIRCNDDGFGTSIQRSRISFIRGQWQTISLLVQMNEPENVANGVMAVYYNGVKAIEQTGLQIRKTDALHINGMFFSTFFGGSDDEWATPITTHSYFRNVQLFAGTGASTLQGSKGGAAHRAAGTTGTGWALGLGLMSLVLVIAEVL